MSITPARGGKRSVIGYDGDHRHVSPASREGNIGSFFNIEKMLQGPLIPNSDFEKQQMMRVICGAKSTTVDDAKELLQALGLIDYIPEENQ
jgi:hypothetical protein